MSTATGPPFIGAGDDGARQRHSRSLKHSERSAEWRRSQMRIQVSTRRAEELTRRKTQAIRQLEEDQRGFLRGERLLHELAEAFARSLSQSAKEETKDHDDEFKTDCHPL